MLVVVGSDQLSLVLCVFGAMTLGPRVGQAQPPVPAPVPAPAPAPVQTPDAAPSPTPSAVDDAAWSALEGRSVVIDTAQGPVTGELLRSDGDTLVLVKQDGQVQTLPKTQATAVRVAQPAPAPVSPAPAPAASSTPAPTSTPTPAEQMGGLDPAPANEEEAEPEDELSPGQQRRNDRREQREHALLGAFAMHGATYSHWRGDGVSSGNASYAMDWGVGANLSPGFGMYAMVGGLYGAKIDNDTTKANYTHIAALFAFGGKHYYSTVGAGVGFSRLRFADDTLQKDTGLALPFKLVGKIPLPKKLYLGIGLTYEFAALRGFSRFVNAIGGQIVVGRW